MYTLLHFLTHTHLSWTQCYLSPCSWLDYSPSQLIMRLGDTGAQLKHHRSLNWAPISFWNFHSFTIGQSYVISIIERIDKAVRIVLYCDHQAKWCSCHDIMDHSCSLVKIWFGLSLTPSATFIFFLFRTSASLRFRYYWRIQHPSVPYNYLQCFKKFAS